MAPGLSKAVGLGLAAGGGQVGATSTLEPGGGGGGPPGHCVSGWGLGCTATATWNPPAPLPACSQPHGEEISPYQREGTKGEVIYYSISLCLFPEKLIMLHCCIRYFQKDYIFLLWLIKKLNPSVFLNTLQ